MNLLRLISSWWKDRQELASKQRSIREFDQTLESIMNDKDVKWLPMWNDPEVSESNTSARTLQRDPSTTVAEFYKRLASKES